MQPIDWMFGRAFTDGIIVRFYVGTRKYGDLWAVVDAGDWPKIADRKWRATKRKHLFYVRSSKEKPYDLLHRVLTNAAPSLVVDHWDGDGLNNRRSNIRECTQGENVLFGADRRRGFERRYEREQIATKPHVVKRTLADGTVKEYVYKTRSKTGTKTVVSVKDAPLCKMNRRGWLLSP